MPSDADTAEILAELAALRELVKPRRHHPPRSRRAVMLNVTDDERAAIEAAADARGLNLSDLLRVALEPILQRDMPRNRFVPIGLHAQNRRKPARFDDGKSDVRELNAAIRRGLIAKRTRDRDEMREMMAETAPVPIVPKLPKSGG